MSKKNISQDRIIQSFLASAFDKSAGATSLSDIADALEIKKASLYNHFENRDQMYSTTMEACKKEISSVNFLMDKTLDSIRTGKGSLQSVMKRLITRYFNLYETEPLFQMYVFVHSEQFFNISAHETVKRQTEKLNDEIKKILDAFTEAGRLSPRTDRESKDFAASIAAVILNQLDYYISCRKETVRRNPESGAGSLFALPSDDAALNRTLRLVESLLKAQD